MAEASQDEQNLNVEIDPDFEPQKRPRSCTWPLPRPESGASKPGTNDTDVIPEEEDDENDAENGVALEKNRAEPGPRQPYGASSRPVEVQNTPSGKEEGVDDGSPSSSSIHPSAAAAHGGSASQQLRKSSARRNAWGNYSYADLITQAIESSPENRLTLSQIYDWMVRSVPYFKDKGDSNSSAGWKVVGLVVALSGLYLLLNFSDYRPFFSQYYILIPGVLAVSSAALLLVSGVIGCMAATRTSVFLQGVFVYLLVVVMCLEGTASALAYYHSDKVDSDLSALREVFYNYSGSSQDPLARAVDSTQEELRCCGVQDLRDWLNTPWFNRRAMFPQSCCNSSFSSCTCSSKAPWELYAQGCQVKVEEAVVFVLSLITWSLLPLLLVEIVGVTTMAQMMMNNQLLLDYTILEKQSNCITTGTG